VDGSGKETVPDAILLENAETSAHTQPTPPTWVAFVQDVSIVVVVVVVVVAAIVVVVVVIIIISIM